MKTFTRINEATDVSKITVIDGVNYLSVDQLNKYLDQTRQILMPETVDIVNYLIANNDSYIADLSNDYEDNALAGFYNNGMPKATELKKLWRDINVVVKNYRTLEIPVFQTKKQFNSIVNKTASLDSVVYDFTDENCRNFLTKKYNPLIIKICRQFLGKSTFSYEDLYSCALEGFTWALNNYGKIKKSATDEEVEKIAKYGFGNYAAYMIRNCILEYIKNFSHTVRIPISQQKKERIKTGRNTKSNSISGDKAVGHDDQGNKTLFDFMKASDDPNTNLNNEDIENLWNEIYDDIKKKFGDDSMFCEIFFSINELNGYKKLKNKELAKKFNICPSNVTYYNAKVLNYIMTNKEIMKKIREVYDLMKECQNDIDKYKASDEQMHFHINENGAYLD